RFAADDLGDAGVGCARGAVLRVGVRLGSRRGERRVVLAEEHGRPFPSARRGAGVARTRGLGVGQAPLFLFAVRALLRRAERLQALALGVGQHKGSALLVDRFGPTGRARARASVADEGGVEDVRAGTASGADGGGWA